MELSGTITATELAEIFQLLTTTRKEGTLTVSDGKRKKAIYFSHDGVTLLFDKDKRARSLGQLLLDYGRIGEEQLQAALDHQQATGKRLGEVLREMGLVTEADIEELVRTQIEEEIFDLLSWRGGTFQFRDEPAPEILQDEEHSYTSLLFDPNSLLMEAARRMDEWERIGGLIRTGQEVFQRVEGAEPQVEAELEQACQRLWPFIDGSRTAEEILRQAKLPKFEVYSVLYQLRQAGALSLVPPEELNRRATEAIEAGDLPEGLRLLRSAVAQAPEDLQFLKNLGKACDVAGDRDEALQLYARVVREYLGSGALEEAQPVLTRMGELAPETPTVLALEVSAALAAGDTPEAVRKCLALLRAAERERSYRQAKGVVERVLTEAPQSTELREAVADLLTRIGDRRQAVQQYEQVARMYVSSGRSYYARGVYQRILELDPLHEEARRQVEALGPAVAGPRRRGVWLVGALVVAGVVAAGGWWWLAGRSAPDGGTEGPGSSGPAGGPGGAPAVVTPAVGPARLRELEQRARRLASEGKIAQAISAWQEAATAAAAGDARTASQYRREAQRLQRTFAEARQHFSRARSLEKQGNYQGARDEYLALAARYDFAVSEFDVRLPIPVVTVPKGAEVLLDGEPAGRTPTVLRLPPFKQFRVTLRFPGHETSEVALSSDTVSEVRRVLLRQARWSKRFSSGLLSGPAGVGEEVFVVSGDGTLWALALGDGAERWRVPLGTGFTVTPVPAGSVLVVAGQEGVLYGLDRGDGAQRWQFTAAGAIKGAPRYDGTTGLVFFGTLEKDIYAVEAASGREVWRFATSGNVEASPAVAGGKVISGSLDGRLYALEATTGRRLWSREVGGPVATSAVVSDGVVALSNLRGEVLGLSLADGEERWRYRAEKPLRTGVVLASGAVGVGLEGGGVVALEAASGRVRWQVQGPKRITALAARGERLWVGGADGSLLCLEGRTGEVLWQARLTEAVAFPLWVGEEWLGGASAGALWSFPW